MCNVLLSGAKGRLLIDPSLVHDPGGLVENALVRSGAIILRDPEQGAEPFLWKCGIHAPIAVDCRVAAANNGARTEISDALALSIGVNFPHADRIISLCSGGITWGALAAAALDLPSHYLRSEPKADGRGQLVEPPPPPDSRVVLLDDTVASGRSVQSAVAELRRLGVKMVGVQSIVNWDFLSSRRWARENVVSMRTLASFPGLLRTLHEFGLVPAPFRDRLIDFFRDPLAEGASEPVRPMLSVAS